jgi:hypothetical protein
MSAARFTCANCGHEHDLEQIRRSLYLGQRTIGDYQAARRGGGALGRRLARRYATRAIMRSLFR